MNDLFFKQTRARRRAAREMQKRLARIPLGERRAARFAPPPPVGYKERTDGTVLTTLPIYAIPKKVGFRMKGAPRGRR